MSTPEVEHTELARLLLGAQQVSVDDGAPNMFEIERGLKHLEASGGQAALLLKQYREEVAQCERNLRLAKVRAYAQAKKLRRDDGRPSTVQEREMYVLEATDEAQFQLDLAKASLSYARDLVDERSGERSSLQTRAKLTLEALALAGYAGTSAPRWRADERNQR